MDTLTAEQRSRVMAAVRSKNTGPEMIVRSLVHRMGYRFRLHRRDLPGCPDLVFVKLKKAIFVHGCFWHMHSKCSACRFPKTRRAWWKKKLLRNVDRDRRSIARLRYAGWKVLVVWECGIKNLAKLEARVGKFLG